MGAGASASVPQDAQTTLSTLILDKPSDGSDIKTMEQAMTEIIEVRRVVRELHQKLKGPALDSGTGAGKRAAVMDRGGDKAKIMTTFVRKVVQKPEHIKILLRKIVSTNILFSSYSKDEHNAVVDAFEPSTAAAGSYVIEQGKDGDIFYVVESGALEIFVRNTAGVSVQVGSALGTGSYFGELALMYNTPRAASVKATADCKLWQIDRLTYRGIILQAKFIQNQKYIELLENVTINSKRLGDLLSNKDLEKLVALLIKEEYGMGEVICLQGNVGDNFYVIASGEVIVRRATNGVDETLATLKPGAYFGEQALLRDDVRQATCIAGSKVTCLTLGRDDFINLIGTMEDVIADAALAQAGSNASAEPNQSSQSPQHVGTSSLSPAKSVGELDPTLLEANAAREYKLSEFSLGTVLGRGAFGTVKICKLIESGAAYAIKCQSKSQIVKSNLQAHILSEVTLMRLINHPFVIQLFCTMQDERFLYFVTELLQGGELFTYLRKVRRLMEPAARFYAASVITAFEALHKKSIAYRDLKPENLVMNKDGYIKVIDLGLAKQVLGGKTYTLCGTPDYLAPEVILNEGHDTAVDYWALGVLIYEMVVGLPPFYAQDPIEVYERILSCDVKFHSSLSNNLADMLKKLLTLKQSKRLGSSKSGVSLLMKQKWFSSFDWSALTKFTMTAPFIPTVQAPDDVSNFDSFEELDLPDLSDWYPENI